MNLYTFVPYDLEKNLGAAYNRCLNLLEDDDWAVILDHDAMFVQKDWLVHIEKTIKDNPEYGFFTCYMNRVGSQWQMPPGIDKENHDMFYHMDVGKKLRAENPPVQDATNFPYLSGVVMIVKKSVWDKIGWDPSITPVSRTVDYMGDCVYHGLKSVLGKSVQTVYDQFHMYRDIPEGFANNFHGKGFTLCGNLDPALRNVIDEPELKENLKNKVYDCVIFSRIYRSTRHYEEVCEYYKDNEIVIIDGHDLTEMQEPYRKHLYFKRELIEEPGNNLFPISFSIPKEKLVDPNKTFNKRKPMGHVIPGDISTYIFKSEQDYYEDYFKSYHALTHKKGGWDCMRHLEIMANKCVPVFPGIEECPPYTMTDYPKDLLHVINVELQRGALTSWSYESYAEELYDHVAQNQTTEAQALRIIEIIKENI